MSSEKLLVPTIPKELLDYLEKVFPCRIPTSYQITEEELRILQGQVKVIDHLRFHYERQSKTVLKGEA